MTSPLPPSPQASTQPYSALFPHRTHSLAEDPLHLCLQLMLLPPALAPAQACIHPSQEQHPTCVPGNKGIPGTGSHQPLHIYPHLLAGVRSNEEQRNTWLLQPFLNAVLSKTAGRLLTAFTCSGDTGSRASPARSNNPLGPC